VLLRLGVLVIVDFIIRVVPRRCVGAIVIWVIPYSCVDTVITDFTVEVDFITYDSDVS
ncbi:25509_t:CDS:1, partial [Gigaspora margarita]